MKIGSSYNQSLTFTACWKGGENNRKERRKEREATSERDPVQKEGGGGGHWGPTGTPTSHGDGVHPRGKCPPWGGTSCWTTACSCQGDKAQAKNVSVSWWLLL